MDQRAIKFWQTINNHFQSDEVSNWLETLRAGQGDWFRNFGLLNIVLARQCRIGRIGFDEAKFESLKTWSEKVLNECELTRAMMQN